MPPYHSQKSKTNTPTNLPTLLTRAAESYKRTLLSHEPGLTWDYLVLTAANEHQAAGYRHEIATRTAASGLLGAFFPASQQTLVVPDPPGFRAGSGGATFGVLRAIAQHQKSIGDRTPFHALRILIIHSGGASQRLPLYSPLGKIFAPLPLLRPDGQLMTLFDHLYLLLAALPARLGPGMLVAAGDVLLLFDAASIPQLPPGITALSIRTAAAQGEHHGIFKIEGAGLRGQGSAKSTNLTPDPSPLTPFPLVATTMQKATVAQMRAAHVTDSHDRVLIDSGLLFFDAASTTALYALSKKYTPKWHRKTKRQIDLYSEIIPAALHHETGLPLDPPVNPTIQKLHTDLRRALQNSPLRCYELPSAHFLHLGTTRQLRDAMTGLDPSPVCSLFQQNVRISADIPVPKSARIYQSVLAHPKIKIAKNIIIENCLIESPLTIGPGSILSNLSLQNSALSTKHSALVIPPDTLLYAVPIRTPRNTSTVTVILGTHDDPKTDRTFCNLDLRQWLTHAHLTPTDLWNKSETHRTLWTAKLFTAQPLAQLLWLIAPASLTPAQRRLWKKSPRYSMADILEHADPAAMAAHRDTISGMLQARAWIDAVIAGSNDSIQNAIPEFTPAGYQKLIDEIHTAALNTNHPTLIRTRLLWALAEIIARPRFPKDAIKLPAPIASLQKQSFTGIREAMTPRITKIKTTFPHARIKNLTPLTAAAPARLDFAGGWTDTPPYCLENGGTVLNLAINLNDAEPIQSTFHPLDQSLVRLIARDLGRTLIITDPAQLRAPVEPGDPFALHIIALRLTGLAPAPHETTLRKWLTRLHSPQPTRRSAPPNSRRSAPLGFELATASNLPSGSGMGTSSILAATTLAVLRAATGQPNSPAALFEQTLLLEQHLGTGGGWQDQVGGILGGAKLTTTRPGIPQRLRVRPIPLAPAQRRALEDRLVVYFTGQQRLARNILREVMGRYLSRDPATLTLFNELALGARACESALRVADWPACAAEINRYWRIKRALFPGSSTPAIDALFLELRPHYLTACLAGAGGGGFAYFLCADAAQAHHLRAELRRLSALPGSLGLTFDATLNTTGLRVFSPKSFT